MSGSNGHDRELAAAIAGESDRAEKRFLEAVHALELAKDPEWQRRNAGLIAAVRRWQGAGHE
jgi:hypothetical protein